MYIFSSKQCITTFFESILAFIEDDLHIIVRDFNRVSTLPLTVFDMTNLCFSPTTGNFTLDRVIVNRLNSPLRLRAPISANEHCLLLLRPRVYPHSGFYSVKQTNRIRIHLHNFSYDTLTLPSPLETSFVSSGRISIQVLKSIRRGWKHLYKSPNNYCVLYISILINAEIKSINTKFGSQILSGSNRWSLWQDIWLLYWKNKTRGIFFGCWWP